MNEIQKELDTAFSILYKIKVSKDDVDRMAIARDHLRKAFKLAQTEEESTDGG